MPQTKLAQVADLTLRFVEAAGHTIDRSLEELQVYRNQREKAAAERDALLKELMDAGLVSAQEKAAATAMLGEHVTTFAMLRNAARQLVAARTKEAAAGTEKKANARLGNAESEDNGRGRSHDPASSLTNPHVGRRTTEKKASDVAMLTRLGLPIN